MITLNKKCPVCTYSIKQSELKDKFECPNCHTQLRSNRKILSLIAFVSFPVFWIISESFMKWIGFDNDNYILRLIIIIIILAVIIIIERICILRLKESK